MLHGETVSSRGPAACARSGLGRTFQRMELCDALSVGENVALGREAGAAGSNPLRQIFASPQEAREMAAAAAEAMELCGIEHLARRRAGS